ncbi:PAS domain S-box protein [Methylobacterium sp. J-068]|uniref:PAS domain S-box protein n=1 Tax=Methylobacterium sp. J-068 TaxID=2836649 RepID=UPI001FBBE593|nr:PAS domain S-box protein [Methylobacterium sp. J-068]MCJ2033421.1 PAS domain S-box protein [Methylobacterium sp. J-068]
MSSLHRLLFCSRHAPANIGGTSAADVAAVIDSCRRHNGPAGITGVLALHGTDFAQVLEGPEAAVEETFARIARDSRHNQIVVLARGPVAERRFPASPMAFLGQTSQGRDLLDIVLTRKAARFATIGAEVLLQTFQAVADTESAVADTESAVADTEMAVAGTESAVAPPAVALPGNALEWDAVDDIFLMIAFTADGTILRENGNVRRVFGYDAGELPGRAYDSLVDPADLGRLDGLWAKLRRGETVRADRRGIRKDGTEIWLRSTYRPRRDAGGVLRDVVEIATDFTQQQLRQSDDRGQILAINKAQAICHFGLDGTILDANPLFLAAMGYAHADLVGHHHRLFVEPATAASAEYAAFWADLAAGRHRSGEYRRLGRNGTPVWLQATYNPILDMGGRPFKIVKYATVVTQAKLRQADYAWQIAAIHKSHAVITFDMNGIVLDANDNFLEAVGYALDEIVGHHHRKFVEPAQAHSADYAAFWRDLSRGRHQSGQFRRRDKAGRAIWLQATYNPIFDMDGKPIKVVKYATVVTDEKLRQADHQGQIAAIHKAQAVISFDLNGIVLDANDNFLASLGYRLSEVVGRHHSLFVDPDYAASPDYAAFWAELAAGRHQAGEYRRYGRDGRDVWLQANYNPIFDMEGRPFRVVKYATDVTLEKARQAEIDGQITAIGLSQGVMTLGLDGTIIDVNPHFLAAIGYARAEIVGRHHSLLVEPGHAESRDYAQFWETLRVGNFLAGRYRRRGKDGRELWIQATYSPILDLEGRPAKIVKLVTDVTSDVALEAAYEEARQMAQHDAATALPNRVRLAAFMAEALSAPGASLTVLYLDLDGFKPINDTHGHHVGDRVLGELAERMRRALAPGQLAARVGGDEFVVVAPELPEDAIEPFCRRLLGLAAEPFRHEAGEVWVSLSIGVAQAPADGTTPETLLRCADAALYRSKQAGGGQISFHAATRHDRLSVYRTLVDALRRGLAQGELFLDFQPRFDTRTRTIQSVEALARWTHPERGRISPADFIPVAERSGLIIPLGAWVLRSACLAAKAWPGLGLSVNVSPVQFTRDDLVETVAAILAETGMDPRRLELEITEGALQQDSARARDALQRLKSLGVQLAMDDFGTGYSSLSALRSFPFDVIKIDRQFIADMEDRPGGRDVVRTILSLGKALDMSVTAEGVETIEQLTMLVEDGCPQVQGYLLGRPMPAAEIAALVERERAAAEPSPPGRRDAA